MKLRALDGFIDCDMISDSFMVLGRCYGNSDSQHIGAVFKCRLASHLDSILLCFDFRRDEQVRVQLGLVEGGPADPHVEEGEPGEAAGHAHICALLCLVSSAHAHVEGQKAAQDQSDGCENGGADEEIVRLLKHVFESAGVIECEEKTITKLFKNYNIN